MCLRSSAVHIWKFELRRFRYARVITQPQNVKEHIQKVVVLFCYILCHIYVKRTAIIARILFTNTRLKRFHIPSIYTCEYTRGHSDIVGI